jgi:transposase
MEVVHERICGIDVHQASLVCCIVEGVGRQPKTHFKSFGTMTEDVSQLVAWLKEHGVQEVVMEATGIYWKPVYALLEEHAHIIVANPQHVKAIAGRKTDKKDSQWLAELARVGLVHNSFVPAQDMRDLRELVRHRASVTRAHVTQRNQIIRPLEWSNIKLSSVLSDVFGTSGRRLLEALVVGTQSAEQMSQLVDVRVKADRGKIARALTGLLSSAARWLLGQKLDHLRQLDGALREVDAKISSVVEAKGDWQIA